MSGLNLVTVHKGVSPYEKYERVRTIAADTLTAVTIVKNKDNKDDGREFAMKYLSLTGDADDTEAALEELRNECEKYCSLDPHPNIVSVYDVFEYRNNIYLIMEFCTGGNIIGHAIREGTALLSAQPESEKDAAKVIGKLLSAVRFLHANHLIHGDLRAENVCFENEEPGAEIKLIDFGMARRDTDKSQGECQNYVKNYAAAPETYKGFYLPASDMWAVGVLAFMTLSGKFPFQRTSTGSDQQHVLEGKFEFDFAIWDFVSDEAKDFIKKLLIVDPTQRLTAAQAQEHAWIQTNFKAKDRAPSGMILQEVVADLRIANEMSSFHKIVMTAVAHRMSTRDLLSMRKAFDVIDVDNSGMISLDEFKEAMAKTNVSKQELQKMFSGVEVIKDGKMSYIEFLASTIEFHSKINEAALVEAFHLLDKDNNGYLSPEDIMKVYPTNSDDAKAILEEVGIADGKVSCEDFLAAFRKESTKLRAHALDPVPLGGSRIEDM